MAIFNSYVSHYQRVSFSLDGLDWSASAWRYQVELDGSASSEARAHSLRSGAQIWQLGEVLNHDIWQVGQMCTNTLDMLAYLSTYSLDEIR